MSTSMNIQHEATVAEFDALPYEIKRFPPGVDRSVGFDVKKIELGSVTISVFLTDEDRQAGMP